MDLDKLIQKLEKNFGKESIDFIDAVDISDCSPAIYIRPGTNEMGSKYAVLVIRLSRDKTKILDVTLSIPFIACFRDMNGKFESITYKFNHIEEK